MSDESKRGPFTAWFFVFAVFTGIVGMFLFGVYERNKLDSGEVVTIGDESFIYVRAEKLTDRRGAIATLEAILKFRNEHPDLCVTPWHHETASEPGEDMRSYGIWIHHRPKPPGGC